MDQDTQVNPKSRGARSRTTVVRFRGGPNNHRRRHSAPPKQIKLGNHTTKFCQFCTPSLSIRLDKKKDVKRQLTLEKWE